MDPAPNPMTAEDLAHIEAAARQRMVSRAEELWADWPVNPEDLRTAEPVSEAQALTLAAEVRVCWTLLAQTVDLLANADRQEALANLDRAGWDYARAVEWMSNPDT